MVSGSLALSPAHYWFWAAGRESTAALFLPGGTRDYWSIHPDERKSEIFNPLARGCLAASTR